MCGTFRLVERVERKGSGGSRGGHSRRHIV